MPCALVRLSKDGHILFSNPVFARWLDIGETNIAGRRFDEFLTKPSRIFFHTHVFTHLHLHASVEEIYLSLQIVSEGELHVILNGVRHGEGDDEYFDCVIIRTLRRPQFELELKRMRLALTETTEALTKANAALAARRFASD